VVIGGRYGLASKEFTPAMAKAVFDELAAKAPRRHFTVGINDDVTRLSLAVDAAFDLDRARTDVVGAVFFGLGADGTVGANKNTIKIIGEETDNFAQGYFVYDSKKSGAVTISHLRFGPNPIRAPYLISHAKFVACHQYEFLDKYDVLEHAAPGGVFLLNAPFGPEAIWDELSAEVQSAIVERQLRFFVIDAYRVARDVGMGTRINTIMQTCFFAISGVLPRDEAIERIKGAVRKTYSKRGEGVVNANFAAIDHTLAHLYEIQVPSAATARRCRPEPVATAAPDFVKRVTAVMLAGKGDSLPVSAFPPDGTWPVATAQWEKRNVATEIPAWDASLCIQCNKCAFVCPHAAIRTKVYPSDALTAAPATFKAIDFKGHEFGGMKYTVQVAPEDCTGCRLCVMVCPAKDKGNPRHKSLDMHPQRPLREAERANYAYFLDLPEADRTNVKSDVKSTQFLQPLFEYSGACAGCGETPYIKLVTQLFGDRALIANATGCSSIYGGNLPTTPYAVNRDGRGPGWSNSLFEDNAEFGLGMRLALDQHRDQARGLVTMLARKELIASQMADALLAADQCSEAGIAAQRQRITELRRVLTGCDDAAAVRLVQLADHLVKKSVWIIGGDGWAYDIGYGGLDHILALNRDVNILVLDTEVYSNTGGQQSKATPLGAAAKFAVAGKSTPKKDLGLLAMAYDRAYVARVAFGAKDTQTVKAFTEAEAYPGTSLIIAYSHCIAHGYDMAFGLDQQKRAVDSGYWPLFRFDPRRRSAGEPALVLDSGPPKIDLGQYVQHEARYRMVEQAHPDRFKDLLAAARTEVQRRYAMYARMGGEEKRETL
jgi:pyruvate-ferredoxin/flavodoxin oxidoreductase